MLEANRCFRTLLLRGRGPGETKGAGRQSTLWEARMAAKREKIKPNPGDSRYVRRDEQGHFTNDQVQVGRSLQRDRRQHSKNVVPKGQGDRGDQKPAED